MTSRQLNLNLLREETKSTLANFFRELYLFRGNHHLYTHPIL